MKSYLGGKRLVPGTWQGCTRRSILSQSTCSLNLKQQCSHMTTDLTPTTKGKRETMDDTHMSLLTQPCIYSDHSIFFHLFYKQ